MKQIITSVIISLSFLIMMTNIYAQENIENELNQLYEKPINKEQYQSKFGKATIPLIGAWEENKISDHELTYCIDDSVDPYLEANVRDGFNYWSGKLYNLNNDKSVISFHLVTYCNTSVDIKVKYQDTDSKDDYAALTESYLNEDGTIYFTEMTLYPNYEYQKEGYDYERSGKWGDLPEYNEDVANDGPSDPDYYKYSFNNIKHEVGHVLGLDHVDNNNYLMNFLGEFDRDYHVSGCELAAVIQKNFIDRDLDKVVCEPSNN